MVSREREPVATGSTRRTTAARDWAVCAPHAPGPGRVDVHQLGSGGAAGAADAPRRHALRAHGRCSGAVSQGRPCARLPRLSAIR